MGGDTVFQFEKTHAPPVPWRLRDTGRNLIFRVTSTLTIRRIQCGPRSTEARATVRAALGDTLRAVAGRPVNVRETSRGPEVVGNIRDRRISISVTYAGAEAWLALGWDGPIGIDAVRLSPVPEWEQVASTYLGAEALGRLHVSTRPELDFAMEWAGYEARLKMHGLPLREGSKVPTAPLCEGYFGCVAVAVAFS